MVGLGIKLRSCNLKTNGFNKTWNIPDIMSYLSVIIGKVMA